MNFEPTELFILDNNGRIRVWSISVEDYEIVIEYGQLGGAIQIKTEEVEDGKGGRTLEQQILSRMASRISSQLDKGYSRNIEDAKGRPTNKLGYMKPMLAHKIKDYKPDWATALMQYKYDGHRCMIINHEGEHIAYTRNGKIISAIPHIIKDVDIPKGDTIDGELYNHDMSLQQISSMVKRDSPHENSCHIRYHVYDIMLDIPYRERLEILKQMRFGPSCEVVPTNQVEEINLTSMFNSAIEEGYEGLIIRHGESGYEDGKRSKSLIKVKQFEDGEFTVLDITRSADGWGILHLEARNGNIFTVSAPGTMEDKKEALTGKANYIGKDVTIEYANLTKDGIPFHPVAKCWVSI